MDDPVLMEPRPEGDLPILPEDVTILSDQDLMSKFREQIEWINYLTFILVEAESDEADAEAELKLLEAHHMLGADKLWSARAARDSDPDYVQAKDTYRAARARRKALEMTAQARERSANFLSRELSRRVGREPMNRRDNKWNT